ncbi:MAG: hypothetical protein F4X92_03110 [Gammaproteobacteria bacterium]|nr:hypothetical protein [Gammaproteobacteria bacterium]
MCEDLELVDVLREEQEQMPEWLEDPPFGFNRKDFFRNRTLFYPGSGGDGHPVKLCARSNAAHTFIYVDYGVSRDNIQEWLEGPDPEELPQERPLPAAQYRFLGYTVEYEQCLKQEDLRPGGWTQHASPTNSRDFVGDNFIPYALFVVLKRDENFDDAHGPERLAGLFVGGDGIATYDALYCQADGTPSPYLVVLQEHGFGGNYDSFGQGGLLEQIASKCNVWPKWLLVADNTDIWDGYEKTLSLGERGGQHNHERNLYRRIKNH